MNPNSHSVAQDAMTLVLRLAFEPNESHSPETLEVMARWKPALDAMLRGKSMAEAVALAVPSAGPSDDADLLPGLYAALHSVKLGGQVGSILIIEGLIRDVDRVLSLKQQRSATEDCGK